MDPREQLRLWVKGISVYKEKEKGPLTAFETLVDSLNLELPEITEAYTNFYYQLIGAEPTGSFTDFLFEYILTAENPFTLQCAKGQFLDTESGVRMAAKTDLDLLQQLSKLKSSQIKELLFERFGDNNRDVLKLPDWMNTFTKFKVEGSWGDNLLRISEHYKENGYGRFSVAKVFEVTPHGEIQVMEDIIKPQKDEIPKETMALLNPIFEGMEKGKVENVVFEGDGNLLSKALFASLQTGNFTKVKLVRFPQTAMTHFTEVCEYLSSLPGVFILFPDNFTSLLKGYKQELEVYLQNKIGLHLKERNLALFVNQTLTEEEKKWFTFSLKID